MSELKENFIINNSTSRSFFPDYTSKSLKDYSLKELKTSHNGLVCINYNSEYLRERLCKLKEESNYLIKKMNLMENANLKEKNNLEKIILSLREENHLLKQNISSQKILLQNYLIEKEKIIKDLKEAKKINNELIKEKKILLESLTEANNIINNNISPKLKKNESDLSFLKNKINEMQKTIINIKNEKMRLIDDNMNQNQMIKVLSSQNKKLMKEIKMKYNKDLNFIEDIEKFGIETNMTNNDIYEEMKTRYEINIDKNKEKILNKRNINKILKTDIRDDE